MGVQSLSARWGVLIGIGLLAFLLGIVLCVGDSQGKEIQRSAMAGIAALSAIPNLFFFFWALRKNQDTMAYGILLGSILWALFTFGVKLFG